MSRTNKPYRPTAADFYPTPAWCVHRLLERVELPPGAWLEPAVGDGAIVNAVNERISEFVRWDSCDIRDTDSARSIQDFLELGTPARPCFDVVITNPPYNQALDFVRTSMRWGRIVVMLLRLNWVASAKRHTFIVDHPPDVYVLPNRPSFTGKGTDATEYAWFIWGMGGGKIEVLDLTPLDERRKR